MVSEFDLPCTACGHELAAATVPARSAGSVPTADGGTDPVTVAECPRCGTRHYPEAALEGAGSRR